MNFTRKPGIPVVLLLSFAIILSGCVRYRPQTSERASFMERAQTQTEGDLTVTLTVLSDKESKNSLGLPSQNEGSSRYGLRSRTRERNRTSS